LEHCRKEGRKKKKRGEQLVVCFLLASLRRFRRLINHRGFRILDGERRCLPAHRKRAEEGF